MSSQKAAQNANGISHVAQVNVRCTGDLNGKRKSVHKCIQFDYNSDNQSQFYNQ